MRHLFNIRRTIVNIFYTLENKFPEPGFLKHGRLVFWKNASLSSIKDRAY